MVMKVLAMCLMLLVTLSTSVAGQTSSKDINEWSSSPPNPLTSYHYKEDTSWTGWNKFWFASSVGTFGVVWYLVENLSDPEDIQDTRNFMYGALTVLGTGVTIYNSTIECN